MRNCSTSVTAGAHYFHPERCPWRFPYILICMMYTCMYMYMYVVISTSLHVMIPLIPKIHNGNNIFIKCSSGVIHWFSRAINIWGGGGVYTPLNSPITKIKLGNSPTKIKLVNSPISKNAELFHQPLSHATNISGITIYHLSVIWALAHALTM